MLFETKQTRENITYDFQPNDQLDAIKQVIVRKFNSKQKLSASAPSRIHSQHHIGGLPSPPVEEKKVIAILPVPTPCNRPPPSPSFLSSQEIREKIQLLKDEKHRLFQLIKQLMIQEESKKRQAKARELENKKRSLSPPPPPPAQSVQRKKSRWGAPAVDAHSFYSSNHRYIPYSNQQQQQQQQQRPRQQHYPASRPPYSR